MVSQSRLRVADLRTRNRPDGCLEVAKKYTYNKNEWRQAVIQSTKRQTDYQGYRTGGTDRIIINSMPILVGAAMIAAAILLSTLVTALGTRYVGLEGPTEDSAWLVDRLTGSIYRCEARARGPASCAGETATGSVPQPKP
jgi:hypothetical protein